MTEPVKPIRGEDTDFGVIYVPADDYARLEQECERLKAANTDLQIHFDAVKADYDAALKQVEGLRGALVEARELIGHGDFDTGICCCGGDVDKHGFGDGHSPVDEGGYYALGVMQRIDAALQATPCAPTK